VVRNEQWSGFEDLALYDISPAGAAELNRRTAALPQTYYFSWGTSRTVPEGSGREHLPAAGMHRPLQAGARFMGSLRELPPGAEGPPERWWENDGVVNTCSMDGPRAGSSDAICRYDGHPRRGCWNFMGVLHPLDHWQVHLRMMLGDEAPPGCESLLDYYSRMARFLCSLPPEEAIQPPPRTAPQGR
jgi:triacylglycerol lipase